MKKDFDEGLRSVDRSNHTFGRAELYLLLLLFVGGTALDSGFLHPPQPFGQSSAQRAK